jgi:hypothetical protein
METQEPTAQTQKDAKKRPVKVTYTRKHRVENINRNTLASALDAYAVEGRAILALSISRDIGGTYEVVSFVDVPVPVVS